MKRIRRTCISQGVLAYVAQCVKNTVAESLNRQLTFSPRIIANPDATQGSCVIRGV